ncbi:MAG: hypothetical protein M1820_001353 [Bogoriella megaspora]|nr:MAG: hypothetical protein M1820_001353 [Bogoriella megaspora]
MSQQVTKKGEQQVAQPARQGGGGGSIEHSEQTASANASAGLNLNIFAAFSGLFGSKKQKRTEADGSSTENEQSAAKARGAGVGNMEAVGAANAETRDRRLKAEGVDHLAIEGRE